LEKGICLLNSGQEKQSLESFAAALQIFERDTSNQGKTQFHRAVCLYNQSMAFKAQNSYKEAKNSAEKSLELYEQLSKASNGLDREKSRVYTVFASLALNPLKDFALGSKQIDKAIRLYKSATDYPSRFEDIEYVRMLGLKATLQLFDADHFAESVEYLKTSNEIGQKFIRSENRMDCYLDLAQINFMFAKRLSVLHHPDSIKHLSEALEFAELAMRSSKSKQGLYIATQILLERARLYGKLPVNVNRQDKDLEYAAQLSIALDVEIPERGHLAIDNLFKDGEESVGKRDFVRAKESFNRAEEKLKELNDSRGKYVIKSLMNLYSNRSMIYLETNEFVESIADFESAEAIYAEYPNQEEFTFLIANASMNAACAHVATENFKVAERLFDESIANFQISANGKADTQTNSLIAFAHSHRASIFLVTNDIPRCRNALLLAFENIRKIPKDELIRHPVSPRLISLFTSILADSSLEAKNNSELLFEYTDYLESVSVPNRRGFDWFVDSKLHCYLAVGAVFQQRGELEKSMGYFVKAKSGHRNGEFRRSRKGFEIFVKASFQIGEIYLELQDYDSAKDVFEKTLIQVNSKKNDSDLTARFQMIKTLIQERQTQIQKRRK